tara:strand:+ start:196955 stop:197125 length:171 start_codon:yes stop_codon:yes gene_type:complete
MTDIKIHTRDRPDEGEKIDVAMVDHEYAASEEQACDTIAFQDQEIALSDAKVPFKN